MNGQTHLLGGIAAALLIPGPSLARGALALIGSLAPDLDAGRQASIANPTRSKLLNTPLRLLARGVQRATGHRGWLHRAPALVVVWFAGWQLGGAWLGLAYGWTSHIMLDMLTVRGIKLLGGRPWRLARFRTGGRGERWIVSPALLLLIGWRLWLAALPLIQQLAGRW